MERNIMIKLNRDKQMWRMDPVNFFCFMSYVSIYTRNCNPFEKIDFQNVLYAEISPSDLEVISGCFLEYWRQDSFLLLIPKFLPEMFPQKKKHFLLNICESWGGTWRIKPVVMIF